MAYEDAVAVSHAARQNDLRKAVTPADAVNADQAHYVRLMQAAATYGIRNGALQALEQMGLAAGVKIPNGYR
jgi:hypothetical protein